jgi:hypothetical protein
MLQIMKRAFFFPAFPLLLTAAFGVGTALGQASTARTPSPTGASADDRYAMQARGGSVAASAPASQPVSYASMTQLNGMLSQLESSSSSTQTDLAKLRIERWKTDGGTKRQMLANVDSIQRNLQSALPGIIAQLRVVPEDLPITFKLYRNLDALYDVVGTVVEGTGAFGSKDDFQALSNDLNGFESTRKELAQRIEGLSSAKESEIARLRTDLKTAQAALAAAPPKKIVVDDNEPPKKSVAKKKPVVKKKPAAKPAATPSGQTPPAQAPAKPQ